MTDQQVAVLAAAILTAGLLANKFHFHANDDTTTESAFAFFHKFYNFIKGIFGLGR